MDKTLSMADLLKKTMVFRPALNKGDVIEGTVVSVKDKYALIDIGSKSEGILPLAEFKDQKLEPNEKIWVYVSIPEDKDGQTILSLQKAAVSKAWEGLSEALDKGKILEAEVTGHNKGGLTVKVLGLSGFIPFSQMINPPDLSWERPQFQSFVDKLRGTMLKTKIVELDEGDNRIILSERQGQEEELLAQKREELANLNVNETQEAEVISVLPYGLKVKVVSGLEGLVPVEEISWEQKEGLLTQFSAGQKIMAKIIEVDPKNSKLRLSLRQMGQDPWEDLALSLKEGKTLEADVAKIASFGVYVKVLGIEGMLPLSEFDENADIRIGEKLKVKVSAIDKSNHRLDLKLAK